MRFYSKFFIIIFLVLIFVLSCNHGFAEDLNNNETVIEDLAFEDSSNLTSSICDSDLLGETYSLNGGKFSDIQKTIDEAKSGDTIELSGVFKSDGKQITINKKLTIVSTNTATLDGSNNSRIFYINANANGVVISNLFFKNGYHDVIGGAIYLDASNIIIEDCVFQNCVAHWGGAISTSLGDDNNVDNVVIKNSEFYSNHASYFGGAIAYVSKNLELTSCVFDYNYVELVDGMGGGGVLLLGFENQDNNCRVTDCIFNNNYMTPFDNNNGHAGVACLRRGVTFTNCNFTNNSVYDTGVLGFHDGGVVISCNFYNNSAKECGGALRFDPTDQPVIVEDSYFENNVAKYGGAIFSNSKSTINNCIFVNNVATDGGSIYSNQAQTIMNCTFKSNHAQNNGGALYNNHTLLIENSNFFNNYALNNGGAIYNLGTLDSNNCQFQSNKAKSTLIINSPNQVKCSDDAIIKVIFEGGNNIINSIWSKNSITLNDKTVNPNNKIPSQKISINLGGKIFNSITNANGEALFKFNTINFKVDNYKGTSSFLESNDYFGSSSVFNIAIKTKIEYKSELKNKKKIKKVKQYQVYLPKIKYIKVKYKTIYHKSSQNVIYSTSIGKPNIGFKKIKTLKYKWKNTSKKSLNLKYKWYKSKYRQCTKYKAKKITYKYVNGKLVKKSVNKNYKFTKYGKFKYKRTKDWSKYVLPSIDCESDNKKIIKLSKKIIKKEAKKLKKSVSKLTDKQKANAILNWVQKNKKYGDYGNTRYGALKSLSVKRINCVDSTHLTVALLRAANIPAKYNAKTIGSRGHCWPLAYFGGKWNAGEATEDSSINFGKCTWTNKNWVKKVANPGTYINLYKFSKKFVKYGKNKKWTPISEYHYINGKWLTYYVLEGNADTAVSNTILNKFKIITYGVSAK